MTTNRTRRNKAALIASGTCFAIAALVSEAQAIECKDGNQRVQGNLIATPYCQDDNLARVARQAGVRVTAERIRNNPGTKRDVCRLVGRDIRVQDACVNENQPFRGNRF
jgi:hypothetical protein